MIYYLRTWVRVWKIINLRLKIDTRSTISRLDGWYESNGQLTWGFKTSTWAITSRIEGWHDFHEQLTWGFQTDIGLSSQGSKTDLRLNKLTCCFKTEIESTISKLEDCCEKK